MLKFPLRGHNALIFNAVYNLFFSSYYFGILARTEHRRGIISYIKRFVFLSLRKKQDAKERKNFSAIIVPSPFYHLSPLRSMSPKGKLSLQTGRHIIASSSPILCFLPYSSVSTICLSFIFSNPKR